MTEIEDDVEVRLGRTGRSGRGGVPTVAWALAAVLVAVIGLAVAGDRLSGQPAEPTAAAADPASSAGPAPSPRATNPPPARTPAPYLPPIPNAIIPGAPRIALGTRLGDDLALRTWRSGQAVFAVGSIYPGVFTGLSSDGNTFLHLSPSGAWAAIVDQHYGPDGPTTARVWIVSLASPDGDRLWESGELQHPPELTWAPDDSLLAIAGGPTWMIVRVAPGEPATATTIPVSLDPAPPSPSPRASVDPFVPELPAPDPIPIAFSADGHVLYGAIDDGSGRIRPAIRVGLDVVPLTVTPIDRFPTDDGDRLVPTGYPGDRIDPTTGRIAHLVFGMGTSPQLEIHEPETGPVLVEPPGGWRFSSSAWVGDGRLLGLLELPFGLNAESPEAFQVEFRWVEAGGSLGDVALSAERVGAAGILGSRPGFVTLNFHAGDAVMFAILRTQDGATASVRLRIDDLANLVALELIDPLVPR